MTKILPAFLLLGIFYASTIKFLSAQDPVFSQYFANPMYLNPALTGMNGGLDVNLNGQKMRYKAGSFRSSSFSTSMDVPCIQSAFGLSYVEDRAGDGPLKWQRMGLSWAWYAARKTAINDTWDLRFGLNASYNQRIIDRDNLVFTDQLHPIYGNTGPSQVNLSGFGGNNSFFDLDAGVDFWGETTKGFSYNLGFTANHLVRADPSPINANDTLPIRYTAYVQGVLSTASGRNSYWIIPMAKVEMQRASYQWGLRIPSQRLEPLKAAKMWRFSYGALFALRPKPQYAMKKIVGVWGGLLLHNSRFDQYFSPRDINTLTLMLGFNWQNLGNDYSVGLSYDYDYSGTRSDTGGIFELSLNMTFPEGGLFCRSNEQRIRKKCPVPTVRSSTKQLYHKK